MGAKAHALLADAVLLLHFAFVLFVVGGMIVIWVGYLCEVWSSGFNRGAERSSGAVERPAPSVQRRPSPLVPRPSTPAHPCRRWRFIRNPWFRVAHLLAMGVVVAESVCGVICPLTAWESDLRLKSGERPAYAGSFVQHWVHRVMFFEIPERIFTVIYVAFFALILLSLVVVRPRAFRARSAV